MEGTWVMVMHDGRFYLVAQGFINVPWDSIPATSKVSFQPYQFVRSQVEATIDDMVEAKVEEKFAEEKAA